MVRGDTAHTAVLHAVTDAGGLTHLVTDEAMVVGRRVGRYAACCGAEIVAASLTMPEAGRCQPCRRWRAGA
jgi:hypothetical protein